MSAELKFLEHTLLALDRIEKACAPKPYRGAQVEQVMSGDEYLRLAALREAGQRDLLDAADSI